MRELMKHAGIGVKQLKRTRIGGLRLGGLGVGQVLVGAPPPPTCALSRVRPVSLWCQSRLAHGRPWRRRRS